jgi:hypothetical protein
MVPKTRLSTDAIRAVNSSSIPNEAPTTSADVFVGVSSLLVGLVDDIDDVDGDRNARELTVNGDDD